MASRNSTIIILTRYAWKDGSRVCLNIRSTKDNGKSDDYRVLLSRGKSGTCTCEDFQYGRSKVCKHLLHCKMVEQVRADAKKEVDVKHLDAVAETVNAEVGSQVVTRGCVDLFSMTQEQLVARRIAGEKKQKQLKREYQAKTVAQQAKDRETAVLQPRAFSILRVS